MYPSWQVIKHIGQVLFGHTSLPNLIHLAIWACAFQNAFPLLVTTIPNHMFFPHTQKTSVVWFFDFPKNRWFWVFIKNKKTKIKESSAPDI
jgi:hypothetical protein